MFLRNLTIRSRFFILYVVTILLWLCIAFILYSYLISNRKSYTISEKILTLSNRAWQLNNTITEFMYYDINSNTFYETGQSSRSENFERLYIETYNYTRELQTENPLQKNPLINQKLEHFSEQLVITKNLFLSLSSKLKETGYDSRLQHEELKNQLRFASGILTEDASAMDSLFKTDLNSINRKIGISLVLIVIFTITVFLTLIYNITRSVQEPLNKVNSYIKALVRGRLPDKLTIEGQDEIAEISQLLNDFTQNLREKARFAGEIGRKEGNLNIPLLSEDDILGNALLEMGNHLQSARVEDQKHQAENEKRRWVNEGLAKFEEILRIHSSHIETLADQIIQNLVRYLNAGVGALFLTDTENENQLKMAAVFAFDRKKYVDRSFRLGEGLVGTCAIEKQRIFLTEVPENYIQITSGLGNSKPRSLLLIPLKLENEVLGVIEIASLKILEEHEINFVETIGESIASAISGVRMNMRTISLLEQSQKQAREMAEQEEKMRQHMIEFQSTRKEAAIRESEISSILNAIQISSLVAEYSMNEELISINDKFLVLLETYRDHIIGKKNYEILGLNRLSEHYKDCWQKLREGKTVSNIEKTKLITSNEIWLRQTYTPILDTDNVPYKVLNISIDITETIKQKENLEKQANEIIRTNIEIKSFNDAVDQALIKCVYSPSGQILEMNENYENITGFTRKEMIGKNNRIFLQKMEREQFEKIWTDILKDKPYSGVIRRTKPAGEEIWIMSTFTPVKDENGVIFKIFFLGQDITEKKLKYQLLEEANREIERLKKR
jgi:methyl-accepting chemotaxis protein